VALPHTPQNRNPGWSGAPHEAQSSSDPAWSPARAWPQSRQNANPASFSLPQRAHRVGFAIRGKIVE
jgi:hypothetical protein